MKVSRPVQFNEFRYVILDVKDLPELLLDWNEASRNEIQPYYLDAATILVDEEDD